MSSWVLAGGAFDPLHAGHLAYLRAARAHGPLCVAVATDATIQATKGRPALLPQAERLAVVGGLVSVTKAIAQDARGEAGVLLDVRPHTYVKGADWRGRLPADILEACAMIGLEPRFAETPRDSSSGRLGAYVRAIHEQGLSQLEATIAAQRPAQAPWTPAEASPYDFETRQRVEGRHPALIRSVFQPQAVLDVGCGPGHLVTMLKSLAVDAYGIDKDEYDLGTRQWFDPALMRDYDLVICREVLEHLTVRGIRQAVPNLCALSSRYVYVTTRHPAQPRSLFDVQTSDDLDPDHRSMLPQAWLRSLFVLEGFRRRADLEERLDWQHKGRCLVYERPL